MYTIRRGSLTSEGSCRVHPPGELTLGAIAEATMVGVGASFSAVLRLRDHSSLLLHVAVTAFHAALGEGTPFAHYAVDL